jgi:hypothetical protein
MDGLERSRDLIWSLRTLKGFTPELELKLNQP